MNDYITPQRAHTALLTVDAQRDYIDPDSPVKSTGASHALEPLGRLVHGLREAGLPIFHAVRFYKPDGSNVDLARRRAVEEGMRVLMPGSLGADLIPKWRPRTRRGSTRTCCRTAACRNWAAGKRCSTSRAGARSTAPRWSSGCTISGVNTLIVVGANFATSGRATVLEASERDFRVVMVPRPPAACATPGPTTWPGSAST
ncbi:MAG: hypothetical protein U5L06_11745 [Rhodovibrio sp.]|nr:hypothetical protein [Rhodovibrio sp.]